MPSAVLPTISWVKDAFAGWKRPALVSRNSRSTCVVRFGKGLDLSRDPVDALVEMPQVGTQLGDHLDHARRAARWLLDAIKALRPQPAFMSHRVGRYDDAFEAPYDRIIKSDPLSVIYFRW